MTKLNMKNSKVFKEIISWAKALFIAIIASIILNIFIVQSFKINGSSMEPNFSDSEHVIVSKIQSVLKISPNYKEIVIIDSQVEQKRTFLDNVLENNIAKLFRNDDGHRYWIKRVIGKEGDTLDFKDGYVYRNGIKLEETYVKEKMNQDFNSITVPKGYIFVMGDNRNNSTDSRYIGPVPLENVIGKVFFPFNSNR